MTTTKPIPLDENLLRATLVEPSRCAEARAHLQTYLDNGGSVNKSIDKWTLLEISAYNGWAEEARCLLERGANVHANNGLALTWAASANHPEIVSLLAAHDADIHANSEAPLRWAAEHGYTDVACFLLAHGADVHAWENAALRRAAMGRHRATVEALLQAGAIVEQAVHHASQDEQPEVLAIIDTLAAAIPDDQRKICLKKYSKQMPALTALVRQDRRRSNRQSP